MELRVLPDPARLSIEAARAISAVASGTKSGRRVSIGLAGGSTPLATYRALTHEPVAWEGVDWWLSDERWVPHDHPDSNGGMIMEILGDLARIHRPRYSEFLTAIDSAAHYEATLRHLHGDRQPDLALVGMGDDGHIASLFPGTAALDIVHRQFVANWVDSLDTWRLTATFEFLESAKQVVAIVGGEGKATTLAAALEGEPGRLPIQRLLNANTQVMVICDEAAASKLSSR